LRAQGDSALRRAHFVLGVDGGEESPGSSQFVGRGLQFLGSVHRDICGSDVTTAAN